MDWIWGIIIAVICILVVTVAVYAAVVDKKGEKRNHATREKFQQDKISALQGEIYRMSEAVSDKETKIEELNRQIAELSRAKGSEDVIAAQELEVLQARIEASKEELNCLFAAIRDAEREKNAFEGEKSLWGRRLEFKDNKEKHVVEIIRELKETYPELEEALGQVEWKKIWLPKMQKMCKEIGAERSGIYVLRAEDANGRVYSYSGQAVNIKDRWYQHGRKMVGAAKRGNEELYGAGFNIEDFWWDIATQEEEIGVAGLDERERQYIELSNLNKKNG